MMVSLIFAEASIHLSCIVYLVVLFCFLNFDSKVIKGLKNSLYYNKTFLFSKQNMKKSLNKYYR